VSVTSLVHARLPALRAAVRGRRVGDVDTLACPPAALRTLGRFLRDDADLACDHLVDVTVVDRGADDGVAAGEGGIVHADAAPRFCLVVLLASRAHGLRVRIDCPLDDDEPAYPSLVDVWPAALLAERELWEAFGVTPDGHPALRPLLHPEGVVGFPGRLDHPLNRGTATGTAKAAPTRPPAVVIDARRDARDAGAGTAGVPLREPA
jgi:NADH:ubiquinone oxidoreductase subunit C